MAENVIKDIKGNVMHEGDAESFATFVEKHKNNLGGADLRGANLSDANLSGADLSDAYLSDAYLRGANLSDANLSDAYLSDAYLRGANLSDANLSYANLSGAYLRGANLNDAVLSYANLSDANLRGANLNDAVLNDNIKINKTPIQLFGLKYEIHIFDHHIKIGCEFHSIKEWRDFTDIQILAMDGKVALTWWRKNKSMVMEICNANDRS